MPLRYCCSTGGGLAAAPISLLAVRRPPPQSVNFAGLGVVPIRGFWKVPSFAVRASAIESSAGFVKRTEQAWLISQQPRPIACSSCDSNGYVECKWCGGTGFFILGNNMLCEVPSKNTSCVICAGKGSTCCSNCKGTGFRAKWLGEPPPHP